MADEIESLRLRMAGALAVARSELLHAINVASLPRGEYFALDFSGVAVLAAAMLQNATPDEKAALEVHGMKTRR